MQNLEGKIAVVTGASRGIGAAIAKSLAEAGAQVAVVSRSLASGQASVDAINAIREGAAKGYAADVATAADVEALAKQVAEDFGRVDILVNNAGLTRDGLLMRMKEDDWDSVLDTNLKGAFHCVKAFMRPIMKSDAGRIINIASVIGLIGNPGQANYAASKAGLIGFTKSVARELAKRKVTSNAIAPGFITTDMTDALPEEAKNAILGKIPLGDFGEVRDIANLVRFLAGGEGRYITGQVIAVDGGMTMQ